MHAAACCAHAELHAHLEHLQLGSCPGSTLCAALLLGGHLWVGNAGDSRALLLQRGDGTPPLALSRDHVAGDAGERARVQAGGVAVTWSGPEAGWRCGAAGVGLTRALGDFDLKRCRHPLWRPPRLVGEGTALGGAGRRAEGAKH
jgi:serine/threonine protein phosphatase PrpC